ncbi:MAG: response regulator, partial [Candidatus Methylomirabilia bacterium]
IPLELRSRIFEPFFTTKPPGQASGLGLSLCQGVVETHGGAIRVESEPGRGAAFVIELPVLKPPQAELAAGAAEALPPPRGRTILVVEDEEEMADLLAEILSADGHQVETAGDGAMALDSLRERTYEVILCDIRMPELDGPGLYRELERRHPGLRERVIFITGDELRPETREFLEATGAPRLGKPFDQEEVRRAIKQVLRPSGPGKAATGAS